MKEHLHQHMVSELRQSARTDTVFVITAVCFNLVVLAVNWVLAASDRTGPRIIIFVFLIVATMMINGFAVQALRRGRQARVKLLEGLMRLYRDSQVDGYYDAELIGEYAGRYRLFAAVIYCLAGLAILVPLIQWLGG